jgi:voltage-gated potassium channel
MSASRDDAPSSAPPAASPTAAGADLPVSSENRALGRPASGWRRQLFDIIFESNTPAGRTFDVVLLALILSSVLVVMLDSVQGIGRRFETQFDVLEWIFTLLFTLEYIARLACVQRPLRYATSFFGIVDLLSVLPTYLALFFPELQALIDVRVLRLLRVFRILKLTAYIAEYRYLGAALHASRRKILVFLTFVLIVQLIMATVMYVIEGPPNGFTSIPMALYWAITTMTTVGFGDVVPRTDLGRAVASFMMLLGWGIIAVPTGIVTAQMTRGVRERRAGTRECNGCGASGLSPTARFCENCGEPLPRPAAPPGGA